MSQGPDKRRRIAIDAKRHADVEALIAFLKERGGRSASYAAGLLRESLDAMCQLHHLPGELSRSECGFCRAGGALDLCGGPLGVPWDVVKSAGAEVLQNWHCVQHDGMKDMNFTKRIWESFKYDVVLAEEPGTSSLLFALSFLSFS